MSEVKINISADGAQATAEIARVKSAAESASAMMKSIGGKNDTADQAAYLSGLTAEAKTTEAVGKATQAAAFKKKDLKDAIQALSRDVPGLGSALALLKHPFVALVAGIAGFVAALKSQIDAQDEAARASAKLATSIGPLFEQMRRATTIAEAAAAAQSYADSVEAAAATSRSAQTGLDDANRRAAEANEHQKKKIELMREAARLEIKAEQASGKITAEQAAIKFSALGGQFAREDSAAAVAAGFAESQRLDKARQEADARAKEARGALPGLEADAADAAGRVPRHAKSREELKAERAKRTEEIKKELTQNELDIAAAQGATTPWDIVKTGAFGLAAGAGGAYDFAIGQTGSPLDAAGKRLAELSPDARQLAEKRASLEAEQRQIQERDDAEEAGEVRRKARAEQAKRRVDTARAVLSKAEGESAALGHREAVAYEGAQGLQRSEAELAPLRDRNVVGAAKVENLETIKKLTSEEEQIWGEVVAAIKEGKIASAHAGNEALRAIRSEIVELKRHVAQMSARGPQ